MNTWLAMLQSLLRRLTITRTRLLGGLLYAAFMIGGHALLWRVVPQPNNGLDVGLALCPLLTELSVERATSYRSAAFIAWLVGGFVLSALVGAVLWAA